MEKIVGIYKIVNRINGKYYIGSSNNIKSRWYKHKSDLNNNRHKNIYLQRAWNKYGPETFEFKIEKLCDETQLLTEEQSYLNECNKNVSYNISKDSIVPKPSLETRMKMSLSHRGKIVSEETKRKISKNNPKIYLGKSLPKETRKKLSLARIGRKFGPRVKTIHKLVNLITNEIFEGTQYDFCQKHNFRINQVTSGQRKSLNGWILI